MANKYLEFDDTGKNLKEVEATVESAGAGDAGEIVALNASGKIAESALPDTAGPETIVAAASEALTENDVVNFWDDTGTLKVRKADASDATKPAHGYVKAAVENGNNATVYCNGFLPGTGLTKGARYFLSEDAGLVTTTPPTTSGAIVQAVGSAMSATQIKFDPDEMFVTRA